LNFFLYKTVNIAFSISFLAFEKKKVKKVPHNPKIWHEIKIGFVYYF